MAGSHQQCRLLPAVGRTLAVAVTIGTFQILIAAIAWPLSFLAGDAGMLVGDAPDLVGTRGQAAAGAFDRSFIHLNQNGSRKETTMSDSVTIAGSFQAIPPGVFEILLWTAR
jgi:hypothetical protein